MNNIETRLIEANKRVKELEQELAKAMLLQQAYLTAAIGMRKSLASVEEQVAATNHRLLESQRNAFVLSDEVLDIQKQAAALREALEFYQLDDEQSVEMEILESVDLRPATAALISTPPVEEMRNKLDLGSQQPKMTVCPCTLPIDSPCGVEHWTSDKIMKCGIDTHFYDCTTPGCGGSGEVPVGETKDDG